MEQTADPRQRCRGPIEAFVFSRTHYVLWRDPRQRCRGPIEAYLVQRVGVSSEYDPRQRCRGPIEAYETRCRRSVGSTIRDSDVAAPLKPVV